MSKIALTPNASGTGTFTIAAPDSNTNRTLTLPDETGVVLTNASNIEAQVKTATNATGSAPVYACRAWVNFNGTGTVAVRASGNVSSITDVGVGDYRVNLTTAMPNTNYTKVATSATNSGSAPQACYVDYGRTSNGYVAPTTTVFAVSNVSASGAFAGVDSDYINAAVFG